MPADADCRGEVRDRGRGGQATANPARCVSFSAPTASGLQHSRRRRGSPCGRDGGRGGGRCAHRPPASAFWPVAACVEVPTSTADRAWPSSAIGQRARADPPSRARRPVRSATPTATRIAACARAGRRRVPVMLPIVQDTFEAPAATPWPQAARRVRLRRHHGRRRQRRLRLHQASGGRARRASDDHGEHASR